MGGGAGSSESEPLVAPQVEAEGDDQSPVEEVALTVDTRDDPTLPVGTFRMWFLGLLSCILLSFLNQFFSYRTEPFIIGLISVQIVALPFGRFMANVLPERSFRVPFTSSSFSLNPGPFNVKEHVLITIFANAGSGFGNGGAYAMGIVNITRAFYKRSMGFTAGLLLVMTTQVLGYGWAGLMKKHLVEPAHMWWPGNLVQVSLFRTLHEEDQQQKKGFSRSQFFAIVMTLSFCYYVLPGYMFMMLTSMSWVCWIFPKSVLAQQLGSGLKGLGLGSFSLDWATISAYLGSPLVTPWFAICNVIFGYLVVMYIVTPACYWSNIYDAKIYPLFSSYLFTKDGQVYDVTSVVDKNFDLDLEAYARKGPVHMSTFFAFSYGLGFAAVASTLTHVACFHGKYIWERSRAALTEKPDIHTRLMRKYPDVPQWWFHTLMVISIAASIATCAYYKAELQLPWWGVLLACVVASSFTLPIGVITATTNITPGLNIITEYLMGYLLPGQPMANVCFKTYGYISMTQAISFLQDFKLGHYMKVPHRSMFHVQFIGTIVAAIVNMCCAWWLLGSIENICDKSLLPPNSPWTCPSDRVFFDASVIWGLIGPKRMFGSHGEYKELQWFFLGGALGPVLVWLASRTFPNVKWIPLINLPVILGATAYMPPATSVNYISWSIVGIIFNYFIFRYHKGWWQRYNYVFSAAMDAGVAFMGVLLYLCLGIENRSLSWWGNNVDNCPLADCPTAKGIVIAGCPVY
ncbi:hypothetical protein SELMODRAFT_166204 [Selaginella moellendorffii]|uniref:Oligopeptide transporter 4 n=1 Tax=Selaginella moellendorffii TaxID=88036 RepID=D8QWT1_SELML|nr:oligopeptide transporter 2 [Selaginella moellendorffii]EFJ35289.1 hypothetical protein SELMODRAFT_166204 [Selaginella moellendorffii]|eukprot:XP_002963418.1 oligopeptide transporter 2 [Selaginella moellendorffii]